MMPYYNPYYTPAYSPNFNIPTPQTYTPTNAPTIIWVSGSVEAQNYPIAPNNAVTLWDKSGKTVYVKQADATGKPSLSIYDLVERKDSEVVESYVTKELMDEELASLRADIEAIKADMYGVVGKKKKKEVEVDE